MRIVAFANQKGGSGKTTTSVAVAYALGAQGARVLLVDLDPQAHATTLSGIVPPRFAGRKDPTITEVLSNRSSLSEVIRHTDFGYDLALSDETLLTIEVGSDFTRSPTWGTRLKSAMRHVAKQYDFLLIDCAPHLGLVTQCGLIAAHEALIPVEAHPLAVLGLYQFADTIESLRSEEVNPDLHISGVLLCKYSENERICKQVKEHLEHGALSQHLWQDRISRCTAVARSAAVRWQPGAGAYEQAMIPLGQPIQLYDANCQAAKEYNFVATRLLEARQ